MQMCVLLPTQSTAVHVLTAVEQVHADCRLCALGFVSTCVNGCPQYSSVVVCMYEIGAAVTVSTLSLGTENQMDGVSFLLPTPRLSYIHT